MPDEKLPLIVHHGSGLATVGPQSGRIVAEMVSEALVLSRASEVKSAALVPPFRIGEHDFREPDYQQIQLWAESLGLEPVAVIERLLTTPAWKSREQYKTQLVNGRIVRLYWDVALLPLVNFEWVEGLAIESIDFFVPKDLVPKVRRLSLRLPELRYLDCSGMGLISLDLSAVPYLTVLRCFSNQLTQLDLSGVSQLTELWCLFNHLSELDLSTVPRLTTLCCYNNRISVLNLSAVPQLKVLRCAYNQLTELDLSLVPQLTELSCINNQLTELDIRPQRYLLHPPRYDERKARLIRRPDQK
ncbi:MAG: hypothetical protein ABL962_14775, partial [Fimbriimonadaceae bacterium]